MKKKGNRKKAEDVLINMEHHNEFDLEKQLENSDINQSEINIAQDIVSSIHAEKRMLPEDEKKELKVRIQNSLHHTKRRRIIYYWSSAAASIVLILALSLIVYQQSGSRDYLSKWAAEIEIPNVKDEIILMLNQDSVINIYSDNAIIEYNNSGESLTLNDRTTINQNIDKKSTVYNTLIVPFGHRSELILSDGSHVWLNSGSKLVYAVKFDNNRRDVYLEGEAVFDIVKRENQPFFVSTKDINVKVLGTVFNVSAYLDDEYSRAILASGSVELNYPGKTILKKSKTVLIPGEMAVYDAQQKVVSKSKVDTELYTSWKDGYLYFKHESLENIFKKLERYYNVSIEMVDAQLGSETFSGQLDLRNSPEEVLELIQLTSSFIIDSEDLHTFNIKKTLPMN